MPLLSFSCRSQGAKKITFTACHSGKLMLAFTTPDIISTSPKTFWLAELISQFFCYSNSSKNIACLSGKLKTEFTSAIAKSASPGLSDTTSFAHCGHKYQMYKLLNLPRTTISTEYTCFTRGSSVLLLPNSQQNSKFYHNQLGENRNLNKFASRILWLPD